MRILSLELKNIRSYKQEKIDFPDGLVLLAGDIGSGKSTLLLAIEFALFGVQRGQLSGTALLRHGAQEGRVRMTCLLGDEELTITRTLKKNMSGVGQGPGTIVLNGEKQDLTAVELKAKILELLAYPESLLSQHKSLVFRYTVYTPQEHMKQILFEKPEERLDTLRKLFAIDKYKRIRENVTLVSRELRSSIERFRGQGDDLPQLAQELSELYDEQKTGAAELIKFQTLRQDAEAARDAEAQKLDGIEKEYSARQEKMSQHKVIKEKIANTQRTLMRLSREITGIRDQLSALPQEDFSAAIAELKEKIDAHEREEKTLSEHISSNTKNEAKAELLIKQALETSTNITRLENCPTCKQAVHEEHKHAIASEAQRKTALIKERQEQIKEKREELEQRKQELQRALRTFRQEKEALALKENRKDLRKNYEKQLEQKQEELLAAEKTQEELGSQDKELTTLLAGAFDVETLQKTREAVREKQNLFLVAREQEARHEEKVKGLDARKEKLEKLIAEKERAQDKARRLEAKREWLTKHFSNLMFTIEKHVLMTLYHQFNDAFKEWFDALIEDETITVRLDHDFSPLIEQNGYETEIEHLSGGEKTSVALAYRLALNKIINQALPHLKTDGVLILDEPTDGFSSEQLDRVQEVLSELGLDQVLIVSHEPKMESFVDHVVRVVKLEHESRIA